MGDYDQCVAADGKGHSQPCRRGWGSPHSGTINFLICDGSVRSLPTSVDVELLAKLATIAGKESAELPEP